MVPPQFDWIVHIFTQSYLWLLTLIKFGPSLILTHSYCQSLFDIVSHSLILSLTHSHCHSLIHIVIHSHTTTSMSHLSFHSADTCSSMSTLCCLERGTVLGWPCFMWSVMRRFLRTTIIMIIAASKTANNRAEVTITPV